MTKKTKLITKTILEKWGACSDGYAGFNKLFPKGATLKIASEGLIADNHIDWSDWLWNKCKQDPEFCEQTVVTAGYGGTATAGTRGTATAGDGGTATAGDGGTATAGYGGTATAGYGGTATAGTRGTATAGTRGTATAGDGGTATAGTRGTATAGTRGTATAGYGGTATAGYGGSIIILHYTGRKYIRRCAEVGDDGLKPETAYKLDDDGKFVEVDK